LREDMAVQAIAYISQLVEDVPAQRVDQIAAEAESSNLLFGITSILLFDGKSFLQYLKGPEREVKKAYAKILKSTSHNEIVELKRGRVGVRRFPDWALRFLRVGEQELHHAATGDWTGLARRRAADSGVTTAIDRLAKLATAEGPAEAVVGGGALLRRAG
jgi:hypothetical protein